MEMQEAFIGFSSSEKLTARWRTQPTNTSYFGGVRGTYVSECVY